MIKKDNSNTQRPFRGTLFQGPGILGRASPCDETLVKSTIPRTVLGHLFLKAKLAKDHCSPRLSLLCS